MSEQKLNISVEELDARLAKAVQSVKENSNPQWIKVLSLVTAVLAVLTAIASMKGGAYSSRALMTKNEAVLNQAKASDQWAFFQSKSLKGLIREGDAERATGPRRQKMLEDVKRYEAEKAEISEKAKALQAKAEAAEELVGRLGQPGKRFGLSVTLFQVAIALSGLAALVKRRWIWFFGMAIALGGVAYLVMGYVLAFELGV